ncbi:MAG: 1-deoxy-D-xylulose-5-phosphate synthase [Oscillibacter sp.]|nr:1-deoxy-D-xylulose-5-phosphate synthase [Oscillibacter sp.]
MLLETIHSPNDVRKLSRDALPQLCKELREFLVRSVSETGGHLASNLGAVELTVAIHRVFDTERDRLVFDVGHQCYVHKILTGRREQFGSLRQLDGLSGFPKPRESIHDAFIAGHASNSVSAALGMAHARTLQKEDYSVLALIGDGALTGGLAYEGLNNAGASGEPLIVILNDNGMSISRNVGAIPRHLGRLRSKPAYYHFKKWYRSLFGRTPEKNALYRFNHGFKTWLKRTLWPGSTLFEDMGFTYLGPVDGHDLPRLCDVLTWARELHCPVLVHVNTVKGKGYPYAEKNPDKFHGISPFDPATGLVKKPSGASFSSVFGQTLADCAAQDGRVCAITAAMVDGTGLTEFAKRYPDRFFDVGIAEGRSVFRIRYFWCWRSYII